MTLSASDGLLNARRSLQTSEYSIRCLWNTWKCQGCSLLRNLKWNFQKNYFILMNTTLCGLKLHFKGVDKASVLSYGTLPDPRHTMHILNMIAMALINGKRQISYSQQEGDKLLLYPRWLPTFTQSPQPNTSFRSCFWQLQSLSSARPFLDSE